MKKILLLTLLMFSCVLLNAQSFEGTATYKVSFELDSLVSEKFGMTTEMMVEEMKNKGEYFDTIKVVLKEGNYVKIDNAKQSKKILYKADENKIYIIQEGFDHVIISDASILNPMNLSFDPPRIIANDSIQIINDLECKSIVLTWGNLSEEYYFYNSEVLSLDAELFSKHQYESLDKVLGMTNAYPVGIVKTINQFIKIRITLIAYEAEEIDESVFELPKMKKAKKSYAETMKKMTGNDVMKIVE